MLLQVLPPSDVLYKLGPSEKYITEGLDLETAISSILPPLVWLFVIVVQLLPPSDDFSNSS